MQGLNTELYWKNTDMRSFVNIVPTSAITGEGVLGCVAACSPACFHLYVTIPCMNILKASSHVVCCPTGIPDLLQMLVQLTQSRLAQRLMFINELQATVLEVWLSLHHICTSCRANDSNARFMVQSTCLLGQQVLPQDRASSQEHTRPRWRLLNRVSPLRVLQVKVIEGLGTTMDVVLVNGLLREGAQIVVCGLGAPIVTTIRSLLTPHPMKVRMN